MKKLLKLWNQFLGLFPQPLPRGVSEMETFFNKFFNTYDIPNLDSYKLAISTMVMHLGPTVAFKSPFWFYRSVRAAQAKETAYQLIAEDRESRNLAEREAKQKAYDAKQAAVPAVSLVPADEANQG